MGKMLKRIVSLAVVSAMALTLMIGLTGCGGDDRTKIYVYNCGEYINEEVLDIFEKEYPEYKVVYDTFATNEEMYQKIVSSGVSYDVLVPSDYMIERMIKEDRLMEIDTAKLENYSKLNPSLLGKEFDPEGKYSVPYMWGTLGIVYNTKMVTEPVDSWSILWDKKYDGQILMLESMRDTIGFTLKMLGYSMNTTSEAEVNEARDKLLEAKDLYADWGVDTVKDPMKSGSYAMTVNWSGDAVDMISENPDLAYAVPSEGSNVWIDCMVIPKNSQNPEGALKFIDFLCRTDIALMNSEEIGYSTPQMEAMEQVDESLKNNPVYNPSQEILDKCEVFVDLSDALSYYNAAWEKIRLS